MQICSSGTTTLGEIQWDVPMSMLRAQEYFAPLRSRHISLQQWERGQLFDTFGRQGSLSAGGRLGRQKSEGNLAQYILDMSPPRADHAGWSEDHTHHPHRVRPVKKAIARSLSLSAATGVGRNHNSIGGSELVDIKQLQANNNVGFRRNLSFSRSLTSSGEIALVQELEDLEEEPDHCLRGDGFECTGSRTNSVVVVDLSRSPLVDINCESQKGPAARLLVSRSLNSSIECLGSEFQEADGSSSLRSVNWPSNSKTRHPASSSQSWPKKFLSGGLLFSKEKRFFSGVLPLTKSVGRHTHGWASANGIPSSPLSKRSSCCSIQDGHLRRSNLFSRMLSFSRSLDSRGGFWSKNSNSYDESSSKDGLKRRLNGRNLSFSRSFDPSGELSPQDYSCGRRATDPFDSSDPHERTEFLGRCRGGGLSFSRSLDPGGEIVSDDEDRFEFRDSYSRSHDQASDHGRDGVESSRNSSSRSDLNVSSESTSVSSSSEATTSSGSEESTEAAPRATTHKPPQELSWSKKLKVMTSKSGFFFSRSMESRKFRDASHHHQHASMSLLERNPTEPRPGKSKIFGRGFSLSFSRFIDSNSAEENSSVTRQKEKKESRFKSFFTKGLFAFTSSKVNESKHDNAASPHGTEHPPIVISSSSFPTNKDSCKPSAAASRKLFFRDWSTMWSKGRSTTSSSHTLVSSAASSSAAPPPSLSTTHDLSTSAAVPKTTGATGFTASFPSLKYWWSKRGSSGSSIISGHSVTSKSSSDKQSRLVLLEKKPLKRQLEDDNLTVYVGERGGSLTKYILTKQILRHHLFQVLLKCSQDELGSDYDYKSGVPIICDPALFLQVARTVCSTFSSESETSR